MGTQPQDSGHTLTLPPPSKYAEGTLIQFAWDSTSLGDFIQCPRKYYFTHVLGWRSKGARIELDFGIIYHKALEDFEKLQNEGATRAEALAATVRYIIGECQRSEHLRLTVHEDVRISVVNNLRNTYTLLRAVVWYIEQFAEDPLQTVKLHNGKLGLELSFKMDFPAVVTPEGEPYLLCGHIDRLVTYNDQVYFTDRKTTKQSFSESYTREFDLSVQMDIYSLASQVILQKPATGGIIDAVQLAVNFARHQRFFTLRTPARLEEGQEAIKWYLTAAQDCAKKEYYPPNVKSCKLCGFAGICSRDPSVRQMYLEDGFVKEEPWNPLANR